MKCPADGATLLMSERHNVEIDYCPECRGVWLDRGELDKILEQVQPQTARGQRPEKHSSSDRRYEDDRYRDGRGHSTDPKYRKKSSPFEFLGDIFGG